MPGNQPPDFSMAHEAIPFVTGRIVSDAAAVEIPAGTDPAAFSAAQQNAKRRVWRLDTIGDAGAANLPRNNYRARLQVDATKSPQDATLFYSSDITGNTLITTRHQTIPAGSLWEMPFPVEQGALQIGLNASTGSANTPVIVTESSYI